MLRITMIAVLLFVTSSARGAEPDADLKAFEGTWRIEEATAAGRDHYDDFKSMKLTVTGEKYTLVFDKTTITGTIKLDSAKKPKQIDLTTSKPGPFMGRDLIGIYEFKDGMMVVCLNSEKPDRPTKFEAPEKTPFMVLTFKREKK